MLQWIIKAWKDSEQVLYLHIAEKLENILILSLVTAWWI